MNASDSSFRALILDFYHGFGRHELAWRQDLSPYSVLVSEVMLQQTQVSRVQAKYTEWMCEFTDFEELVASSVADVIGVWQGLGYNRRALRLREAAQMVVGEFGGELPRDPALLVKLPGIGPNTAGSIAAFAYDEPVVFIETNIRRVFLHHFFSDLQPTSEAVSDLQLIPFIQRTLDREHPREWYWALMDYGSDLAKRVPNPNRRSRHYAVQSKYEGSARQLRGEVLRQLLVSAKALSDFEVVDERLPKILIDLVKEGFVVESGGTFSLAK